MGDKTGYLDKIYAVLKTAETLTRAMRIVNVDSVTCCPENGVDEAGKAAVMLENEIFRLEKSPEFCDAVREMHRHRNELDEYDKALEEQLWTDLCHELHMTPEQQAENAGAKQQAWISWLRAREKNDFSVFADKLQELCDSEKKRVMSWEPVSVAEEKMSAYQRMMSEFERGISSDTTDRLFAQCRESIVHLLGRINESSVDIRTDFLSRKVSYEQQRELSAYLMEIMGFDLSGGSLAESEHPFTETVGRGDVRITTHYHEDSFISNFYTILHEGGHALFEQMTPEADHDHYIADRKTMGMHESVSRFYENIIGRSRAFIHFVYPKLCEIFPQVLFDVTEQELYEAVNRVEPGLIRMDADELTYVLHIIIRYEIEKGLIDGDLCAKDIPAVWKEKYREYLGIAPENDVEGALQDSHWTSDFGYFPTYALGNIYDAMYANKMREEIDVDDELENGSFTAINEWMKDHVFAKADRMNTDEWIKDITGRELTADDFIRYLRNKYSSIYGLSEKNEETGSEFNGYVKRMKKIRLISAPMIDHIDSADEYRTLLADNFRTIGSLANENRAVISDIIDPILRSEEQLTKTDIEKIESLIQDLMDAENQENIDLPVMTLLLERLRDDAKSKNDDNYLIQMLNKLMEAYVYLIIQTSRVISAPQMTENIRLQGLAVLKEILSFLDKDAFIRLDMQSRELVMRDSRCGDLLLNFTQYPLSEELRRYHYELLEKSLSYAEDEFYKAALPDYDWKYHIYRIHYYYSISDDNGNVMGNTPEELETIAEHGDMMMRMYHSDPEYFKEIDYEELTEIASLRNNYNAGRISKHDFCEKLMTIYRKRNTKSYEIDAVDLNIGVPFNYLTVLDRDRLSAVEQISLESIYRNVIAYIFTSPKVGKYNMLIEYFSGFVIDFIEVPGGMTFEEMALQSFAALHPPTYIHSNMVAKITMCLTSHLIKSRPELFVGIAGCMSAEDVTKHASEIESFAYHAALCHDVGKLIIIDTVSVYGRNILDSEFNIIKEHPNLGAMLLEKHSSTKAYADVARGHHRWYDGQGGYPSDFDISASPIKTIIDITACADCMDAATDRIGRSYSRGKTLIEYIQEVRERSGTQYAPYLYELLKSEEVYDDLAYILSVGRQNAYRNTYILLKNVQETRN